MWAGGIVRLAAALALWGLVGCCGNAHVVLKRPDGGIVGIPNGSNQWPTYYRNQAEELLKKECPQGYTIEKEEVVTIGTVTTTNQNTDTDHFGPFVLDQRTTSSTSSHPLTEFRIFYRPN